MNYKQQIKDKGLKQSWIAEKLGISDAMLSLFLSGERNFDLDKENELKKILN